MTGLEYVGAGLREDSSVTLKRISNSKEHFPRARIYYSTVVY